jgi:hypothetical protein
MPFFTDPQRGVGGAIVTFGTYHPWKWHLNEGGSGANYPEFSRMILDLKEGKPHAIAYFVKLLDLALGSGFSIASVPSDDPAKQAGIGKLVQALTGKKGRTDASGCLVRHTLIAKLATGGDRSVDVHLKSIRIANPALIRGRHVMVLDDVKTSGGSLTACRDIVQNAGALSVVRVAVGETG